MSTVLTSTLAIVAVAISLLSLCVSTWVAVRDRSRLVVRARFWPDSENCETHTAVTIKNKGRRCHHVPAWVAQTDDGWTSAHPLGDNAAGLDLDGGRSWEVVLDLDTIEEDSPEGKSQTKDHVVRGRLRTQIFVHHRTLVPSSAQAGMWNRSALMVAA
jgi:hypothetical protein